MDVQKLSVRVGTMVILFALFLRLGSDGAVGAVVRALASPEAMAVMLYLETGRVVRPVPAEPVIRPAQGQQETQSDALLPEDTAAQVVFAEEDASLVEVHRVCGYTTDLPALLQQPLTWDLTKQTVLILHTHGTESYTKTENYKESSTYRTQDKNYNVVSIGAEIKKILEAGGIRVIHDTTLHDYPSYSSAYSNARQTIKNHLKNDPSIALVLDIHRDSVEDSKGKQVAYTTKWQDKETAQLMMVVGTDANGLNHPDWPQNMALAVKMHALLERNCPGVCRPISFRNQRFNQDLSTGAMLIEVGSAGNTRAQALAAAQLLAQTIVQLSGGTVSPKT